LPGELPPSALEHLEDCAGCSSVQTGFARLDALFDTEPVPLAPPDLLASIMAQVALEPQGEAVASEGVARDWGGLLAGGGGGRTSEEVRGLRRQLAALLGAAAAVAVVVYTTWLFLLPPVELSQLPPALPAEVSLEGPQALLGGLLDAPLALAQDLLALTSSMPAPPLALLLLLLPVLALVNWGAIQRLQLSAEASPAEVWRPLA
jgi:hypothetical protein